MLEVTLVRGGYTTDTISPSISLGAFSYTRSAA